MVISHYTIPTPSNSRPLSYHYYKLYICAPIVNNGITTIISILFSNGAIFSLPLPLKFHFPPKRSSQNISQAPSRSVQSALPRTGSVSFRSKRPGKYSQGKYKGMHRTHGYRCGFEIRLRAANFIPIVHRVNRIEEGGNNANKHLTNVASRVVDGCHVLSIYTYRVIKM